VGGLVGEVGLGEKERIGCDCLLFGLIESLGEMVESLLTLASKHRSMSIHSKMNDPPFENRIETDSAQL